MDSELNRALDEFQRLATDFSDGTLRINPTKQQEFRSKIEQVVSQVATALVKGENAPLVQSSQQHKPHTIRDLHESAQEIGILFNRALANRGDIRFSEQQLSALRYSSNPTVRDIERVLESRQLLLERFPPNAPGISAVIIRNGEIVEAFGCGLADVKGTPMTPDSPQHFGSVSKQFTAMCILMLENDVLLSLDDDIRKYLPDLPEFYVEDITGQRKTVTLTIDHLLYMTSGLPNNGLHELLLGKHPEVDGCTTQQELEMIFRPEEKDKPFRLAFSPGDNDHAGDKIFYSNINYDLLAEIVFKASGQTIRDYAEEKIFRPLSMHNTHIQDLAKPVGEQTIPSYERDEKTHQLKEVTSQYKIWGSTGVIGTTRDMAQWQKFIATNPLAKRLYEPKFGDPMTPRENSRYARGLFVSQNQERLAVYCGGMVSGFLTNFLYVEPTDPSKDSIGIFLAQNSTGPYPERLDKLADQIATVWTGSSYDAPIEDIHRLWPDKHPAYAAVTKVTKSAAKRSPTNDVAFDALVPFVGKYYALGTTYEMKPVYVDEQDKLHFQQEGSRKLYGLGMFLLPYGKADESRFVFVPDSNNDRQLEWIKNSQQRCDFRILLHDHGFTFSALSQCIGAIDFVKQTT